MIWFLNEFHSNAAKKSFSLSRGKRWNWGTSQSGSYAWIWKLQSCQAKAMGLWSLNEYGHMQLVDLNATIGATSNSLTSLESSVSASYNLINCKSPLPKSQIRFSSWHAQFKCLIWGKFYRFFVAWLQQVLSLSSSNIQNNILIDSSILNFSQGCSYVYTDMRLVALRFYVKSWCAFSFAQRRVTKKKYSNVISGCLNFILYPCVTTCIEAWRYSQLFIPQLLLL